MGPPSLFVWLGKRQATWEPQEHVVVQGTSSLQLSDPYISKDVMAPLDPLANALEEGGDVAWPEAVHIPIGERQHGRLEALTSEDVMKETCCGSDGPAQPLQAALNLVNLDYVVNRVTCFKGDKPRAVAGGQRAKRRASPQRRSFFGTLETRGLHIP